jgi:hypothetical protein
MSNTSCNDCSFEKSYCQHRSCAEDLARSKNHEPRRGSRRLPQEARHEGEECAAYLKALFELHKGNSCKVWEETERGWVMNIRAWSLPRLLDLFGDIFSAEPIYEMYIASEVTKLLKRAMVSDQWPEKAGKLDRRQKPRDGGNVNAVL